MAHYKRGRSRRKVRCKICTDNRYGNSLKDAPKRILLARDQTWKRAE